MRKKIRVDHTTPKNQKIFPNAPIAAKAISLTGFAPLVANTKGKAIAQVFKIGVDLMGNDNSPNVLLESLKRLSLPQGVRLCAIGTAEWKKNAEPFEYIATPDFIGMEESPIMAIRKKRNASLCVGMRLLKEGVFSALVTAGNTGALVSSAKMILSTLKKILRPALLTLMPTKKNVVAVLDVGANVQAKAAHLIQYALVGTAFQKTRGIDKPIVGLLNIGSEPIKGTSDLRLAYHELQTMVNRPFHFAGNIEGKSVFDGEVDVLVTDGFTGNVFLKTAEGMASLILDRIASHDNELKKFQFLHYSEYPGALLAGVKGIVIKCHGYSTPKGFANGVLGAIELCQANFLQKLAHLL